MGPLMKKEIDLSCKMVKKTMHDLENHAFSVYKPTEEGYTSCSQKKYNCSNLSHPQEDCAQFNGTLQVHESVHVKNFKTSQSLAYEEPIQLPSSDSKLNPVASTDLCKDGYVALGTSLETSDKRIETNESFLTSSKSVSSISQGEGSSHSLLESLREHELSLMNMSIKDPFSLANVTRDTNLLSLLNYFPQKAPSTSSRKKLLILDINGILADIVYPPPKGYKADTKIAGRAVFTRPFCSDFLKFCIERFNVAIWSSRSRKIIDRLVNYLMGDMKDKLIFCWDLSHCTESNFRTLENKHKALVFKELRKVWESYDPDLRWKKGEFNESNTLLLDDTPYKALLNPPHTAIFPYSYDFKDRADEAIGPEGKIRAYLEELAVADNVQEYIEHHPFGQSAITERSLSWHFYDKVIKGQSAVTAGG